MTIGTASLESALAHTDKLTPEWEKKMYEHTRGAAAAIIAAKGCTAYGIGNIAASLCKYILYDIRCVRPLSYWQEDLGCCLSMPAVIGRKGIVRPVPIELNELEKRELHDCAQNLRSIIEGAEHELKAEKELEQALAADKIE